MRLQVLAVIAIALGLLASGCKPTASAPSGQEQKDSANTSETPKAASDTTKPSFKITKVEVTKAPQKFGTGAFFGNRLESRKRSPKKGYVFVIVSYSLEVLNERLSYDPKKDFVMSDSVLYSTFIEKDNWMQYNDAIYKKGSYNSRKLYLIPSNRVQEAKIHFLGNDYAIEPFLGKIPK